MPFKPSIANRNYPTPDEARVAHRVETVASLLQIEIDDVEIQATLGKPCDRQEAIIAELRAAIKHARTAQRLLRHEGD
jgi:hypothetical protein